MLLYEQSDINLWRFYLLTLVIGVIIFGSITLIRRNINYRKILKEKAMQSYEDEQKINDITEKLEDYERQERKGKRKPD